MSSQAGVSVEGAAVVHDVRYLSGARTVVAYLVLPSTKPANSGVVFFHWLSAQGGSREEFKSEAVTLAAKGVASLLIQGDFPWSTQPSGADHDTQAIEAELAGVKAGIDLLLKQANVTAQHLAFVGHDYGAMYGAVLLAEETRFSGAVLMAPDGHWVDWFSTYWSFLGTPADRASYAKALAPLDPVTTLQSAKCKVLLQFALKDEFLPLDRARAVEAAVPANLRDTRWYDSDHGLNEAARSDRDSWLLAVLGINSPA